MGEREAGVLSLGFDRRLKLEFHGSKVTSDAGLLPYRELDDAVGLTEIAGDTLTDTRRGQNGRHGLVGQFRQSVFERLGGYDDVNDADRLSLDPVMRWIVGGEAVERQAATPSQMGRFETERQPDPRRPGRNGLQRTLRMHLLPSPVPVQPVWRSGTEFPASRQRPQCR